MTVDPMLSRAKRFTTIGVAFLMRVTLLGLGWTAVARTYAFAQRVADVIYETA